MVIVIRFKINLYLKRILFFFFNLRICNLLDKINCVDKELKL